MPIDAWTKWQTYTRTPHKVHDKPKQDYFEILFLFLIRDMSKKKRRQTHDGKQMNIHISTSTGHKTTDDKWIQINEMKSKHFAAPFSSLAHFPCFGCQFSLFWGKLLLSFLFFARSLSLFFFIQFRLNLYSTITGNTQ